MRDRIKDANLNEKASAAGTSPNYVAAEFFRRQAVAYGQCLEALMTGKFNINEKVGGKAGRKAGKYVKIPAV